MRKKFNLVLAALVLAAFAVLWAVEGTEAFCVHNETDTLITAKQTSNYKLFQGFTEEIPVGEKRCCNWENKDCNKEGKKDSIVTFSVSRWVPHYQSEICSDFPIKADGRIIVKGKNGNYKCE